MSKFIIMGDSTCDLPKEVREKYDIEYIKMRVTLGEEIDAKEIFADLDWADISPKAFYDMMREGKRAKTSAVGAADFDAVFPAYLEKGVDVLYIACSGALSASVRTAQQLNKEKYEGKMPGKLIVIDSLRSTASQGLILIAASELRAQGKSIEETAAWIEEHKLEYRYAATLDTLTYIAKAGRIKASKAFFGNIFGVKPMLIPDAAGANYAIEKQKGRRNGLLRCVSMCAETIVDPKSQVVFLSHSDCKDEDVELVKQKLLHEVGVKDVIVLPLGPIIGATTGPGTLSVAYHGQKVTVVGE